MRRAIIGLLAALLLLTLPACGGGSVEENKLVVWHDKEDAVIEALTAYLTEAAPGIEVVFEKKTSLTDSLKLVGNDPSSAPDMFIFAHDKIGVFAEMGILADVNTLLNEGALRADLDRCWAVVAEGIQTILRREGYPKPYEALKALTRTNEGITEQSIKDFIDTLQVSEAVKAELKAITPHNYTGM